MRLALIGCLLVFATVASADERILSFHSDIRIFPDGNIEVIETIQVRAEGQQIRRGIYRDFPVEYEDRLGNNVEVAIEPLRLSRNDLPEPFHTVHSGRDIRTYFGSRSRLVDPGVHTYSYQYRATRMLGFFAEHDELYWNVTGNRWAFPIDKASASVTLTFDAPRESVFIDAYTGSLGSKQQDYSPSRDESGTVTFRANQPLAAAQGLTIVVGWPKGFVDEPDRLQKLTWLLADNRNVLAAVIGWLILLMYYIPVWRWFGRDPDLGVITTRYEPPAGFSPASLRYIRQMYYDNKVMTAAILSLAVKGYLEIKNTDETYTLKKLESDNARDALASGEQDLYTAVFKHSSTVSLTKYNEVLSNARLEHQLSLRNDYKKKYFRTNGLLNIPAIVIVLTATIVAFNTAGGSTKIVLAAVVAMFVTMSFFAIIMKRPTLRGGQLLSEMLGFKDYLEIAEKDELNLRNAPEKTPQHFEMLLPFALALSVDQQWSERFAKVLAAVRDPNGDSYRPTWYAGDWSSANLSEATNKLSSSLNSSVSASLSSPGSSSGGGGGGSSGGGGGGGGGGGW